MQTILRSGEKYRVGDTQLAILFAVTAALFLLGSCATTGVNKSAPLTVTEVLKMSKDKVPPDEIIKKMRESGTVYRLEASELAKLHEEGVPDPVINYMQESYLNAVRRNQALRDRAYCTQGPDQYWYGGAPCGWPGPWY